VQKMAPSNMRLLYIFVSAQRAFDVNSEVLQQCIHRQAEARRHVCYPPASILKER
jgi:hypothetical protein